MKANSKIILITTIVSLIIGTFNKEIVFNESNTMIQILLSLLGLCLTSYTFILVPIQSITAESNNKKEAIHNLLREYKDNMLFIFMSCILLIGINLLYKLNFPLISDPTMDFNLFKIYSLKTFLKMVLEDFLCIMSLYSFYDIMQSIFIIVNKCTINKNS